ncbi:Uncharacterized membrane protein YcfT [Aureimonas altamirensis DSM 21988]|uniref:Uncharacterized membrane protein YcfT n=1 Tax=Aureimonas altamirensis DSM 21988 TaxID=1121026 RepID=A0ABY1I5V3_9HYPH|nr:acyltransferase family protein [Aureimonas altamirensis]SHI64557.1 Uncharacterized membrane protein YcfT [Aureimonas altamirensis DSM 21988]
MAHHAERIDWLDVAKGGSILLVVLYHSTMYLRLEDQASYAFVQLNTLMEPVRMPLFFCISGFLAAGMFRRSWGDLFRRRILLFAYLFALWTLIRFYFYRYAIDNTLTPQEGDLHADLLTAWLVPSSGLWFIWALALYAIVAKALRPWAMPALAGATAISVATFAGFLPLTSFAHHNVLAYAPFFLAGAWFGAPAVEWLGQRPLPVLLIGGGLFTALLAALPALDGMAFGIGRTALSAVALATASAVAVYAARLAPVRETLGYFGRNSLPIYVGHTPVVSLLAAGLAAYAIHVPLLRYWGVPFTMVVAIAVAMAIYVTARRVGLDWLYRVPNVVVQHLPRRA